MKNMEAFQRAHLEARRGTAKQASDYCKKDGQILIEFGQLKQDPAKSKRTDLTEFKAAILEGQGDMDLLENFFPEMSRYYKFVDRVRSVMKHEEKDRKVLLYYGDPGTGKTRFAKEKYLNIYPIPIGKDFWLTPKAYGVKHVLIDDFKSNLSLTDLLRLLDRYPSEVPVKGSFITFNPDIIIITSNKSPHDWYKYEQRDKEREALFRRIHEVYLFKKDEEPVLMSDDWRIEPLMFTQQRATYQVYTDVIHSTPEETIQLGPFKKSETTITRVTPRGFVRNDDGLLVVDYVSDLPKGYPYNI